MELNGVLRQVVDKSPLSILIMDKHGFIEYANAYFEHLTGYSCQEVIGKPFGFNIAKYTAQELANLWAEITAASSPWNGERCSLHKNGMSFWESINVSLLQTDDSGVVRYVAIQEDITARRLYEDSLRHQANYDELTGLPNRNFMLEKLDSAVVDSYESQQEFALICVDLDHFKYINEVLGHISGDEILMRAAAKLSSCVSETAVISRIGGDEFAILIPQFSNINDLKSVIDNLLHVFSTPFVIGKEQYLVTVSIGVACFPRDGNESEILLKNADTAMYQAKAKGRNQGQFFNLSMHTRFKQKMMIENALRKIDVQNALKLHYQPIISRHDHKIVSCEGLLRLNTPDKGRLMPEKFIPVAEESGLIDELGKWVIKKVCEDIKKIHERTGRWLKLAINISPRQLQSIGFTKFLMDVLLHSQISPDLIELEITENVLISNYGTAHENLSNLCELGFDLSLDDFGTGYSSLSYLQKYSFSSLKIDQAFIKSMESNNANRKLTETIIHMAHGFNMKVVAEGVETNEQMLLLEKSGCDFMQGYYFSRPLPIEGVLEALEE